MIPDRSSWWSTTSASSARRSATRCAKPVRLPRRGEPEEALAAAADPGRRDGARPRTSARRRPLRCCPACASCERGAARDRACHPPDTGGRARGAAARRQRLCAKPRHDEELCWRCAGPWTDLLAATAIAAGGAARAAPRRGGAVRGAGAAGGGGREERAARAWRGGASALAEGWAPPNLAVCCRRGWEQLRDRGHAAPACLRSGWTPPCRRERRGSVRERPPRHRSATSTPTRSSAAHPAPALPLELSGGGRVPGRAAPRRVARPPTARRRRLPAEDELALMRDPAHQLGALLAAPHGPRGQHGALRPHRSPRRFEQRVRSRACCARSCDVPPSRVEPRGWWKRAAPVARALPAGAGLALPDRQRQRRAASRSQHDVLAAAIASPLAAARPHALGAADRSRGGDRRPQSDPPLRTPTSTHRRTRWPGRCVRPAPVAPQDARRSRAFPQGGAAASARTGEVISAALSAAVRNVLLYRSLLESIEDLAEARREARGAPTR